MGNLKKHHQSTYYNNSSLHGSYQFVSLFDIINQFMVAYVGDGKIIPNASKTDIAFFAQRALAEMSFDTFKSIKAQQINVPPSLTMILPHDYVNYTKISSVDASGIKHPLYPTKHTSNPFQILQDENGLYDFPEQNELIINNTFSNDSLSDPWFQTATSKTLVGAANWWNTHGTGTQWATWTPDTSYQYAFINQGKLAFKHSSRRYAGIPVGSVQAVWQEIDTSGLDFVDLEAWAETSAEKAGNTTGTVITNDAGDIISSTPFWQVSLNNYYAGNSGTASQGNAYGNVIPNIGTLVAATIPATTIRIGVSSNPQTEDTATIGTKDNGDSSTNPTAHFQGSDLFDIAELEWTGGQIGYKSVNEIDVTNYDKVYILVTSTANWDNHAWGEDVDTLNVLTLADNISLKNSYSPNNLQPANSDNNSSTWDSYKSLTPAENTNDDYEDEVYWPFEGERYGLEPSHAQVNGSFYIDERLGKINFSSNISGKTVILDYISDSLGTDSEMQVHKLAEDAMYKYILCDLVQGRRDIGVGQKSYYNKQKFAAVRKAKLRLSNIKLEEITQVLRGKSKQIKH